LSSASRAPHVVRRRLASELLTSFLHHFSHVRCVHFHEGQTAAAAVLRAMRVKHLDSHEYLALLGFVHHITAYFAAFDALANLQ
jgi:hypothetical protein